MTPSFHKVSQKNIQSLQHSPSLPDGEASEANATPSSLNPKVKDFNQAYQQLKNQLLRSSFADNSHSHLLINDQDRKQPLLIKGQTPVHDRLYENAAILVELKRKRQQEADEENKVDKDCTFQPQIISNKKRMAFLNRSLEQYVGDQ